MYNVYLFVLFLSHESKINEISFIAFQSDDDFYNQDGEYTSETSDYPGASDSEIHNGCEALAVKDESKVSISSCLKYIMQHLITYF